MRWWVVVGGIIGVVSCRAETRHDPPGAGGHTGGEESEAGGGARSPLGGGGGSGGSTSTSAGGGFGGMDGAMQGGGDVADGAGPATGVGGSGGGAATTGAGGSASSGVGGGGGGTGGGGGGTGGGPVVCNGDTLTSDIFNPNEVYIAGTFNEGSCGTQVMAHWSTPNSAVGGFDCYFASDRAVVRPTDGRLVYDNTFENLLRTFTCDSCPLSSNQPYPSNPLVNDALLQTPQCPSWTTTVRTAFYADGTYLYACGPLLEWWRASTLVYDSSLGPLRHVAAGLLLTETHVIEEQGAIAHPITGLAPGTWIAVRAYQQGFVIAVDAPQPELFYVDELGAASLLGVYPPPPAGQVVHNYRGAMDGCHNLFQQGPGGPSPLHDLIVRREIGGQSIVVYDEAWNPEVKLHGSWLITGP